MDLNNKHTNNVITHPPHTIQQLVEEFEGIEDEPITRDKKNKRQTEVLEKIKELVRERKMLQQNK